MKTFDQYIGQASLIEARQNYIFGGTDNRNTDVEFTKSLYQLEKGDTVYYYSDLFGSLESMTFERFEKWPNEIELICIHKGNDGKSQEKTIYLDDKKLRYVVAVNNDSVVGTNAKLFIDAINKNFKNFKYAEDDIFDGRVNEARQNYIFGGTDDRNTNTEEADFDFTDDNFLTDIEIERALKKAFETTKRKTADGEETVVLAEITVSQDENYDKLTDETKTIVDYLSTSKTLFIFTCNADGTVSAYQLDSKVFHYLDPSNLRYYDNKGVLVFAEGIHTFDDVIDEITGGDKDMVSDYVLKLAKNTK